MQAAIYARYSTELQREASIEDQLRVCRRLVAEKGWKEPRIYSDMAASGSDHLRPGYQQLLADLQHGSLDVVVAESLDRISRDQEHVAAFFKRASYSGAIIVTVAEGLISELHIGLKGTMSALFLKDLAQKTHRGLEGRVRQGRSAGGISYGYRVHREMNRDGSVSTGERVIDPEEAAVVRRIFQGYAAGKSARTIAIELNREGVPPPRAGEGKAKRVWSFSTISGNWKRGTGILSNELYIGQLVWNRQRFGKDPVTARRQARPNPPEAFIRENVPHLRIVDDQLWQQVKSLQSQIRDDIFAARTKNGCAPGVETARRSRYLLSGLLACGCCGAGYSMISDSRYGCSAARNSGTCTNRKSIPRREVEDRVLAGLRERLMAPELVAEFIAEFQREVQKERREALASRDTLERKLVKVKKEIANIISAIKQGMLHPSMMEQMDSLEAERAELEARLSETSEPDPVALHPGLADIYRRKVEHLSAALNQKDTRAEAVELMRGLIEKVVLHPREGGHDIELFGELGAILTLCEGASTHANARRGSAGVRQVTMVAGTGFEPVTFRL